MNEKISLAIFNKLCKDTNLYVVDHCKGVRCGYVESIENIDNNCITNYIMVEYFHGDIWVATNIHEYECVIFLSEKEKVFNRNTMNIKEYNNAMNKIRELSLKWKQAKIRLKKNKMNEDFI